MMNLSEVGALLESLPTGKGLFYAGENGPYFLRADGSILDKDGVMAAKPNEIGAAAYAQHTGYLGAANPLAGATIQVDLVADAKPTIFYWYWIETGEGKVYMWESGAYVDNTDATNFVESATEPETPTDGDLWFDTVNEKLMQYATDAFVEITDAYISSAAAPTLTAAGYSCVDLSDSMLYVAEAGFQDSVNWDGGTALTAGKIYTDGNKAALGLFGT